MNISDMLFDAQGEIEDCDPANKAATIRKHRILLSQFATAMVAGCDRPEAVDLIQEVVTVLRTEGSIDSQRIELAEALECNWDVIGQLITSIESARMITRPVAMERDLGKLTDEVLQAADEMHIMMLGLKAWKAIIVTPSWDTLIDAEEAIEDAKKTLKIIDEMEAELDRDSDAEEDSDVEPDPVVETLRTIETLVAADAAKSEATVPAIRISGMTTEQIRESLTDQVRARIIDGLPVEALKLIPVVDDEDETIAHPMMEAVLKVVYEEEEDDHFKVSIDLAETNGTGRTVIDLVRD